MESFFQVSSLIRNSVIVCLSFRFLSGEPCAFPCLNGGQCVESESCDCSLYQATGHRCQTGKP